VFAGNSDVSFGDVNLSEGDSMLRGPPHNPGKGGWPTIRYFNKETGIAGADYVKKTSKSMCEELGGQGDLMEEYVEEAGNTSLCSPTSVQGCNEKEVGYMEKMKAKSADERVAQLERLESMEGRPMNPEPKLWLTKRKRILTQLTEHNEL